MAPPWMAMFPPSMRKGLPTSWSEVHNLAWRIPLHDKGHSSPVILDGKIWLTAASPDGGRMFVLGIDEETGRKQWSFRHRNYNAAIRPLWLPEEGLMVVNTGFRGAHLVALKLDASTRGDITDSHVIWDRSKGNPRFAMPVYHRGLIFQISDIGVVNCIDAVTGN